MNIISVLNQSTKATNAQVQACVTDLITQINRDFLSAWNIPAKINFHPSGIAPANTWELVFLDNSDVAGALGYHELTSAGLPIGFVFVETAIQDNTSWTVTASHELMEMLVDPNIELAAEDDGASGSITFYAYEVGDPVENSTYTVGSTLVSDFITPAWFQPASPGPKDHLGAVNTAFQLAPGGYASILQVPTGSGWTQVTDQRVPGAPTARLLSGGPAIPVHSRRWRRNLPRATWRRSKI